LHSCSNRSLAAACLAVLLHSVSLSAHAHVVCTLVTDAESHREIVRTGDCTTRVTPASTFKIAISLMGFDAGVLEDAHAPVFEHQAGEPDWGGENWLQPTDPAHWFHYSVVWYSQRVTRALGAIRVQQYVDLFDYGNRDMAGDPLHPDGLMHAWIDSSLRISPREQVTFLEKLVNGRLPVATSAFARTSEITEVVRRQDGWIVHGKTGTGFPTTALGHDDVVHGWGWFVGWATKAGRTRVFARLIQDDEQQAGGAGLRARDAFLKELPAWLSTPVRGDEEMGAPRDAH
jgi:beta-lactamase class D